MVFDGQLIYGFELYFRLRSPRKLSRVAGKMKSENFVHRGSVCAHLHSIAAPPNGNCKDARSAVSQLSSDAPEVFVNPGRSFHFVLARCAQGTLLLQPFIARTSVEGVRDEPSA